MRAAVVHPVFIRPTRIRGLQALVALGENRVRPLARRRLRLRFVMMLEEVGH